MKRGNSIPFTRLRIAFNALLIFSLASLAGCSASSKVHVFAKYLNDDELNKVKSVLEQSKYTVKVNQLDFPESINSSAVIYSPMHANPDEVLKLIELVGQKLNNKTELLYLKSDNHSYTNDNIGLYMFGKNSNKTEQNVQVLLTSPFSAVRCQTLAFAELVLQKEKGFKLFTASLADPDEVVQKGQWQHEGNTLELRQQNKRIAVYEVKYTVENLDDGLRKGIRLTPIQGQPDIDQCIFDFAIVF